MTTTAPPSAPVTIRRVLLGLLGIPPSVGAENTAILRDDALVQPHTAKVYEFTSADYPGAAQSYVFDTDGTTSLGAFIYDPGNASSSTTAFTVSGGAYEILNVPNSTESFATAINASGLIVGTYTDVAGLTHGFATSDGSTFNDVDFPGATSTQAIDVNDAGTIVGEYYDAANVEHGFISSGGTFTAIDFPAATGTAVAGINASSDAVGGYTDATGTHGFLLSGAAFSPINFPLASDTTAFGINDNGDIAGFYTDSAGKSPRFRLRRQQFQHRGRRRRQCHATDTNQELGTGDRRVRRRPHRATRPHRSVSDIHHQPRTGSKCQQQRSKRSHRKRPHQN